MFKLLILAPIFLLGFSFIAYHVYKYLSTLTPTRPDPVKQAQERLRIAKDELEAARLNKQTEKLYEQLYQEALEEYDTEVKNSNVK